MIDQPIRWIRTHTSGKGSMKSFSLKRTVSSLEDSIITISGPALATSSVIAGIDIVTGGHLLSTLPWLTLAWAVTLLISLDFQILIMGVRARRLHTNGGRIFPQITLVVIAIAIGAVSAEMQAIVARASASSISIDQAATSLGINMVWLIWQRSALVPLLLFLSGWLRDEGQQIKIDNINSDPVPQTGLHITQEAVVNAPARDELPEHAQILTGSRIASKQQEIARALQHSPHLTTLELSAICGCSVRTAEKWAARYREGLTS
jgi:hypothetical protein